MNIKAKEQPGAVAEARQQFVYVILAMMLLAGSSDWFATFVTG